MKKYIVVVGVVIFMFVLSGCTSDNPINLDTNVSNSGNHKNNTESNANIVTATNSNTNPVCQWVDDSDVIITLKFAPGVEKDTSYEAGFYLSDINFFARLARKECDYHTGFSYDELKGKGAVQVGARGYTDSVRRQLDNEPVSVVIGADGHPDIGSSIEVVVLN